MKSSTLGLVPVSTRSSSPTSMNTDYNENDPQISQINADN
jgi:hypothetical protein